MMLTKHRINVALIIDTGITDKEIDGEVVGKSSIIVIEIHNINGENNAFIRFVCFKEYICYRF